MRCRGALWRCRWRGFGCDSESSRRAFESSTHVLHARSTHADATRTRQHVLHARTHTRHTHAHTSYSAAIDSSSDGENASRTYTNWRVQRGESGAGAWFRRRRGWDAGRGEHTQRAAAACADAPESRTWCAHAASRRRAQSGRWARPVRVCACVRVLCVCASSVHALSSLPAARRQRSRACHAHTRLELLLLQDGRVAGRAYVQDDCACTLFFCGSVGVVRRRDACRRPAPPTVQLPGRVQATQPTRDNALDSGSLTLAMRSWRWRRRRARPRRPARRYRPGPARAR